MNEQQFISDRDLTEFVHNYSRFRTTIQPGEYYPDVLDRLRGTADRVIVEQVNEWTHGQVSRLSALAVQKAKRRMICNGVSHDFVVFKGGASEHGHVVNVAFCAALDADNGTLYAQVIVP